MQTLRHAARTGLWRAPSQALAPRALCDVALAPELRSGLAAPPSEPDDKLQQLRAGVAPATGRKLSDIAADIWGYNKSPVPPGHRSGLRVLRAPLKGPLYAEWYPPDLTRMPGSPCKLTPKQERWKAKLKVLRASGKGPPKKGSGKRKK